jgi:hypothetical protein
MSNVNCNYGDRTCLLRGRGSVNSKSGLVYRKLSNLAVSLYYLPFYISNIWQSNMVSIIEGVIYAGSLLLSVMVGALGISTLSRVPGLEGLKHLSTSEFATYASVSGVVFLLGMVLYRWPYMEKTMTFNQLKGESASIPS